MLLTKMKRYPDNLPTACKDCGSPLEYDHQGDLCCKSRNCTTFYHPPENRWYSI